MMCNDRQTHVHEVVGNVKLAELNEDPHNHRFAGVTERVIMVPGGHIHEFISKTDTYEDHFHPIRVLTGLQVEVGHCNDIRHIHFIDSQTQCEDNHCHDFIATTLIDNPIGD